MEKLAPHVDKAGLTISNLTVLLRESRHTWRVFAIIMFVVFAGGFAVITASNLIRFSLGAVLKLYHAVTWVPFGITLTLAAVAVIREAWLRAERRASTDSSSISVPPGVAIGSGKSGSSIDPEVAQQEEEHKAHGGQVQDDTLAQLPQEVGRLHQLPADLADFIGREQEINDMLRLLEQGKKNANIMAIGGVSGVGKSALAIHTAHRLVEHYPEAQIFVDLGGTSEQPLMPVEVMAKVIHTFLPEARLPDDPAQIAQFYQGVLRGKSALIVLDAAANIDQVRLLRPPPSCALIVTLRRAPDLLGFHPLTLGSLPKEEAWRLLQRTMMRGHRVRKSEQDDITRLCGRLPLALRVAGSALAKYPSWTEIKYAQALANKQERLVWLEQTNLEAEAVLKLSAAQLALKQPGLAVRWQMLTVFPGTFDSAAAAAVWMTATKEARNALSELVGHSLLLYDVESDRYRLHSLIRLVARSASTYGDRRSIRAEGQQHLKRATVRHAVHYETVIREADQLYQQGGPARERGLEQFDLEWENIQAGQAWAQKHAKENDTAVELCSAYAEAGVNLLSLRQRPQTQVRCCTAALVAARRLRKRDSESVHLDNLGLAYAALGETSRAIECHEQRLNIARELGDRQGEGQALGNLGLAYFTLGETSRAIEFYEEALEIDCEVSDRQGEGTNLGNLGNAYLALGETRRAIEFYEQALVIDREINDRRGEGVVLANLGSAYLALGEAQRAIEYCEQGLVILRETSNRYGEGGALGDLGSAYLALGETRRAVEFCKKALAINREIGNRQREGMVLANLSSAYFALGETRRAIEYCEQGLTTVHKMGGLYGKGKEQNGLDLDHADQAEIKRVIKFCEQCLTVFRETGDRRGEGKALFVMSLALDKLGERLQAIAQAKAALEICQQISSPNAAIVRQQLARWHDKK